MIEHHIWGNVLKFTDIIQIFNFVRSPKKMNV